MGERKTPPPRPVDHNFQVYAAFIGHQPEIGPPDEPPPSTEAVVWPRIEAACSMGRHLMRRMGLGPVVSPAILGRLMPLLAEARRRWLEAGERLLGRPPSQVGAAPSRAEPPRRRRLNEIKATRTPLRAPVKH